MPLPDLLQLNSEALQKILKVSEEILQSSPHVQPLSHLCLPSCVVVQKHDKLMTRKRIDGPRYLSTRCVAFGEHTDSSSATPSASSPPAWRSVSAEGHGII